MSYYPGRSRNDRFTETLLEEERSFEESHLKGCDGCGAMVPHDSLVADPEYSTERVCQDCLKAIREELTLTPRVVEL